MKKVLAVDESSPIVRGLPAVCAMSPTLKVNTSTLGRLPRGYSITVLPGGAGSLPDFVAGSEGDDALVLFRAPDFRPTVLAREPGGYISTCPLVREGRRLLVAATQFKPGFDAAEARIRVYPIDADAGAAPSLVARLPYTHRVASFSRAGRDYVLASTLCAAKAFKEDWTQPGGIFLAEVPGGIAGPWTFRSIVTGLNKNHGMDPVRLGRASREGYLLSAREGLCFLPVPADPAGGWETERIADGEYSDACAFDWAGDGEPQIFSISPFHGHVLSRHWKTAAGWQREIIHDDLALGHVVWAGELLGGPALLAGSRRENRELRLYRASGDGGVDRNYTVIARDIGPSQLAVIPQGPRAATLYVAAHARDEIQLIELEA
jgi:hypothetical protein